MTDPRDEPRPTRKDAKPPATGEDERSTLLGFLDHLRDGIAGKLQGAPEPQVREAGVPSGTNLLGLVKHVTAVERFVFLGQDAESWPATFQPDAEDTVDGVLAGYRAAVDEANERSSPSMRWALAHVIEETGRHAGHADILREQIDGSTGR